MQYVVIQLIKPMVTEWLDVLMHSHAKKLDDAIDTLKSK